LAYLSPPGARQQCSLLPQRHGVSFSANNEKYYDRKHMCHNSCLLTANNMLAVYLTSILITFLCLVAFNPTAEYSLMMMTMMRKIFLPQYHTMNQKLMPHLAVAIMLSF